MNFYKHPKLLEALDLYTREQDERLPDEKELKSITFSEEFLERMRRMIARHRWGYYALFGTVGRRVASILVALLIAATTATVSVEALREKVFQFFAEVFEKYTQISYNTNRVEPVQISDIDLRSPAYIPPGYVVDEKHIYSDSYSITYAGSNQENIIYYQTVKNGATIRIDTEGVVYTDINVGPYNGLTYTNKNLVFIVFSDDQYIYQLTGTDYNNLLKMANSMKIE